MWLGVVDVKAVESPVVGGDVVGGGGAGVPDSETKEEAGGGVTDFRRTAQQERMISTPSLAYREEECAHMGNGHQLFRLYPGSLGWRLFYIIIVAWVVDRSGI